MKTSIKILTASCLMAAVTACSSDMPITESRIPQKEISVDNNRRSMDEIIAIASEYGRLKASKSRSGQMTVTRNSVVPVLGTATRAESDTLLYAVNYSDDNGYLIVSAEKTAEPILAMIDNGSFNDSCLNRNEGLEYFVDCANQYVKSSKIKLLDSIQNSEFLMWRYCDTIRDISVSGPRLKVNWNKDWPENMYCPNKIAGCVPVAFAQVLSYLKPNLNLTLTFPEKPCNTLAMNWDEILTHTQSTFYKDPTQQQIDSHIAHCSKNYGWHHQLGALVRQIGVWCHSEYLDNRTYTKPANIWELCRNYIPKQNREFASSMKFYDSLKNEGVALVSGATSNKEKYHAWVIDGVGKIHYDIWIYYSYNPVTHAYESKEFKQETTKYLHCNWGLGGIDNGYFIEGVFDTDKGRKNLTRDNYEESIFGCIVKLI